MPKEVAPTPVEEPSEGAQLAAVLGPDFEPIHEDDLDAATPYMLKIIAARGANDDASQARSSSELIRLLQIRHGIRSAREREVVAAMGWPPLPEGTTGDDVLAAFAFGEAMIRANAASDAERSAWAQEAIVKTINRRISEREYDAKLDDLKAKGRFEEALDVMREHTYGFDPGPGLTTELRMASPMEILGAKIAAERPSASIQVSELTLTIEEGDNLRLGIYNSKMGPVWLDVVGWTHVTANMIRHFAEDLPTPNATDGRLKEAESLAIEAAQHMRQRILRSLRNFTTDAWGEAINFVRAQHPEITWRVERLEDVTNEDEPFRLGGGRGKAMSSDQRFQFQLVRRRLDWEIRKSKRAMTMDKYCAELAARTGRSEERVRELLNPSKRKTPRKADVKRRILQEQKAAADRKRTCLCGHSGGAHDFFVDATYCRGNDETDCTCDEFRPLKP